MVVSATLYKTGAKLVIQFETSKHLYNFLGHSAKKVTNGKTFESKMKHRRKSEAAVDGAPDRRADYLDG